MISSNIKALSSNEILSLQRTLLELGFGLVKECDGILGENTSNALREFQIYAKMPFVAQENDTLSKAYLDRLVQTKNTQIYTGPISGELNEQTNTLIKYWKTNQWRCPLVIYAANGTKKEQQKINVWSYEESISTKASIYAYDLSGYFPNTPNMPQHFLLGQFISDPKRNFLGPLALPKHCTTKSLMTPENWLGKSIDALSPREYSTYKVINGTARAECYGRFDCINAYDNAFISFGPCHWTLAIAPPVTEGELCGYFSYLAYAYPEDFKFMLSNFGVNINKSWVDSSGHATGRALFNSAQRKYTAWITLQSEQGYQPLPRTCSALNYFRNWHWFYRFRQATLQNKGCQSAMWDMARIRIKDILATPHNAASTYFGIPITLGDIFTSEQAVSILLRWHVRYPGDVIQAGNASPKLLTAFTAIQNSVKSLAPSAWTNLHEQELIDALWRQILTRGNKILLQDIQRIRTELNLRPQRGSFKFLDLGISS